MKTKIVRSWRVAGAVLAATFMSSAFSAQAQSLQVKTSSGAVEGKADGPVHAFLGIPYAAPPVGDLRWKAPMPPAKWDGVRKATDFGSHCMQGPVFGDMTFHDPGGSEDCLTLNVWLPAKPPSAKLPVMVWIYGGGFQIGATSQSVYDGTALAEQGVVLVSINYRVGVLGFLAHPELDKESPHGASGNYGLMDMVAGLEWVKRNISAFGGDPGNVTIFGQSGGGGKVMRLMHMPVAKGLFHRVIAESGGGLNYRTVDLDAAIKRQQA
ncbi:MAG TPA: carboxylesterase family protein, partial [Candidatus Sulfotelmatobacter sp.]